MASFGNRQDGRCPCGRKGSFVERTVLNGTLEFRWDVVHDSPHAEHVAVVSWDKEQGRYVTLWMIEGVAVT